MTKIWGTWNGRKQTLGRRVSTFHVKETRKILYFASLYITIEQTIAFSKLSSQR